MAGCIGSELFRNYSCLFNEPSSIDLAQVLTSSRGPRISHFDEPLAGPCAGIRRTKRLMGLRARDFPYPENEQERMDEDSAVAPVMGLSQRTMNYLLLKARA